MDGDAVSFAVTGLRSDAGCATVTGTADSGRRDVSDACWSWEELRMDASKSLMRAFAFRSRLSVEF